MHVQPASVCLAVTLVFVSVPLAQGGTEPDELLDKTALGVEIDSMFHGWSKPDSAGCVVGVIRNGHWVHAKGYGSANLNDEVPNTTKTVFAVASMSKSVTCACLAILMDQGKIDPDDNIRRYLPEMHEFDPPVRIRHMVRCHSGLWAQFHILPLAGFDNVPIHSPFSRDDLFTILTGQDTLPFEPGTEFQYGSGEFFLLATVIERVSGKSLADFADEQLFQPLEMTHTFYDQDPTRVVKHRALAYYRDRDGVTREWRNHGYLSGGGGLNTCLADLYKWEQNFRANRLPAGRYMNEFIMEGTLLDNRFCLDADAYRKMVHHHPQNDPPAQYRGLKRIQFTGGWWGMTAAMARFPEHDTTVICLSNNDEISALRYVNRVADVVLAEHLLPRDTPKTPKTIEISPTELRNKAGVYQMDRYKFVWTIKADDQGLQLSDHLRDTFQLKPISEREFRPIGTTPFYESAVFEFVPRESDGGYRLVLRSQEGGVHERINFQPTQLVDLTARELNEYVGEYWCESLGANYRVTVHDGSLWLRVNSRRRERLEATVRDEFIAHVRHPHDARVIRFLRDSSGKVSGLDVNFWRIRSLKFDRR